MLRTKTIRILRTPSPPTPAKILISRETAPNGDWLASQPREVTLTGIAHPVEILTIDWC